MIETLYKTPAPEKGKSECYVLVLASRVGDASDFYAFMEEHGRWDDCLKRFVYEVASINTEEGTTHSDALAMYHSAKRKLALRGFVHSFLPDFRVEKPVEHEVSQLEEMTA